MNPIASTSPASDHAPLTRNARPLLALLFAAALTACGGGDASDSSTEPVAGAPITSPAATLCSLAA
jgi:hypothetical protein